MGVVASAMNQETEVSALVAKFQQGYVGGAEALSRALDARHVAVFGASATPGKWGYTVVNEILKCGYDGELTLVNPRGGEVFSRPLVSAESARGADVALLALPGTIVPEILNRCGDLGIGTAVVYAANFGEAGNDAAQKDLVDAARQSNVHIIGPNCLGYFSSNVKLNAALTPGLPAGRISMVGQSGSVALQAGHRFAQLGAGFDVMLAFGNGAGIGFMESVSAVAKRDTTDALVLYLERLEGGDAFLNLLADVRTKMPVIALLGGQSDAGRRATMSHTGSLIGNWARAKALLEEAGVKVVDRVEVAATMAISSRPKQMQGRCVYVICDGGGPAVMLSDAIERGGFALPSPSARLMQSLAPIVGQNVARSNPLDFQGTADNDQMKYVQVFKAALDSGEFDAVVFGGIIGGISTYWGPTWQKIECDMMQGIVDLAREHDVPVLVQSHYATDGTAALKVLRDGGIPYVEWPDEIMHALMFRLRTDLSDGPIADSVKEHADPKFDTELVTLTDSVVTLLDQRNIRHAMGTPVVGPAYPSDGVESWVLRLDGFAHKTDAGAIELRVSRENFAAAFFRLNHLGQRWTDRPVVRAAPFIAHQEELIVTFFRDSNEGSGIVLGAGGTNTEVLADVSVGRLPKSNQDALRVLRRTKIGRHIIADTDEASVEKLLSCVLDLAIVFEKDLTDLAELEINPLAMTPSGPVILDILPTAMS